MSLPAETVQAMLAAALELERQRIASALETMEVEYTPRLIAKWIREGAK